MNLIMVYFGFVSFLSRLTRRYFNCVLTNKQFSNLHALVRQVNFTWTSLELYSLDIIRLTHARDDCDIGNHPSIYMKL
jgi:hypothetical protein